MGRPAHHDFVKLAKEIFDVHLPQSNQLHVRREDVKVSAADLISTEGFDKVAITDQLNRVSEKRKIDCVDEPEYSPIKHSGKWMPSEVVLFKVGVQQCGWGNWKRVSEVVDTRTMEQVKTFSKTQSGKSVKTELYFMPTLSKLADGLFEISKNVSRVLEKVENSEIVRNT